MKNTYTEIEIQEALQHMQGFVDVSTEDVRELLSQLAYRQRQKRRKKRQEKPLRGLRLSWIQWQRSMRLTPSTVKRVGWRELFYSWLFSFVGIALVGFFDLILSDYVLVIGSFGASAVLIYGAPRSPLSQPRNVIGGHLVSALVGVSVHLLVPSPLWLASALAISFAIVGMHLTKTLHPPGGATALIAIIGGARIYTLGYGYLVVPVFFGICMMVLVAWIANNSVSGRRYPSYWL
jgi:CBS-domain-containing membrane protein